MLFPLTVSLALAPLHLLAGEKSPPHEQAGTATVSSLSPLAGSKNEAPAAKRHPLRGVIRGILTERSSLLIKHEEIPGVMRAMTMVFRVDAATLKAAQEGAVITGLMSREGNDWWLHEAHLVPTPNREPKPTR